MYFFEGQYRGHAAFANHAFMHLIALWSPTCTHPLVQLSIFTQAELRHYFLHSLIRRQIGALISLKLNSRALCKSLLGSNLYDRWTLLSFPILWRCNANIRNKYFLSISQSVLCVLVWWRELCDVWDIHEYNICYYYYMRDTWDSKALCMQSKWSTLWDIITQPWKLVFVGE